MSVMTVEDVYFATTVFQSIKIKDGKDEITIRGIDRLDKSLADRLVTFIEAKDGYIVLTI